MGEYVKFVIIGDARTGSTMLVDALNSNQGILCFGEVYNFIGERVAFDRFGYDNESVEDREWRERDPAGFMRERIFAPQPPGVQAVGFKYLYEHRGWFPGVDDALIADSSVRVIHLTRRNLLRVHISKQIAAQTGAYFSRRMETVREHVTPNKVLKSITQPKRAFERVRQILRQQKRRKATPPPTRPKPTLKVEGCFRYFGIVTEQDGAVPQEFAGHEYLHIAYEDMVADRDQVFDRVQRFLGVEPRPLTVRLERQNPEPLRELIANYDEVAAALRGTEYEPFLEEDGAATGV